MKQNKLTNMSFGVISAAIMLTAMSFYAPAKDTNPARIGPNTIIVFDSKGSALSASSKVRLDALLKSARGNRKIDEVQVAVWSDNPVPRENEELSKADRELAEKRGNAINDYLKRGNSISVSTYNMAERASWLSRTFNTSDAELKSEVGKGGEATMSKEEFQLFKNNGNPSKAVVLVIMKHKS